ncbi:Peroxidase 5 [Nymphaea thermarum]|nr:Peroxidase 5 [Nymphaea thermarum]
MDFIMRALIVFMVGFCLPAHLGAQLEVGFYDDKCAAAESIVEEEVRGALNVNSGFGAGLIRMHFHDCFVRGCDGSVLIDSTGSNRAEKDSPANNPSLRGFEVIDRAKSRLEGTCKGVVSCADILAFAARDSVQVLSGFYYDVPAGRRDGRVSLASEANTNLPPPVFTLSELTQFFAAKGLTQAEMIIQLQHYNSPGPGAQLRKQCPQNPNAALVVPMNPAAPYSLDNSYYSNILANRVLFTSDQTLLSGSSTAGLVSQNSRSPYLWLNRFAAAMIQMGQIGVLTGNAGEIRSNCRVIN